MPSEPSPIRKYGVFALKAAISLGLVAYIVARADLSAVMSSIELANLGLIALAIGLQVLGAGIISIRWSLLLSEHDVRPGLPYLFGSTLASIFVRQFMPSIIGGDALRAHDAWRAGAGKGLAVVSLVVDRLLGLAALAIFALIAVAYFGTELLDLGNLWIWLIAGAGLIAALLALTFIRLPGGGTQQSDPVSKPARILRKFTDALSLYQGRYRVLLPTFALSVLLQINVVVFYWILSEALGLGVPFPAFFVIVPLAIFVMMAPVSINGIGLREAIFVLLLGLWAVDESAALAFAWVEFATVLVMGVIGGIVFALRRTRPAAIREL
ncbi:lysylphosphatidylglycerol synthase transmembrane domain-containing protein [Aestuariibius insulae]|uniref:lysylphosphatidylglycerol synthase transmembrane domain-containing protein n=1 Tax=Aestuariibius insulae TaxID=2058287 RepID=UPI00345E89B9